MRGLTMAIAGAFGVAFASELATITDALDAAATEIETGIFPALATVLGLLVVVAIAVSVAGVVARGR